MYDSPTTGRDSWIQAETTLLYQPVLSFIPLSPCKVAEKTGETSEVTVLCTVPVRVCDLILSFSVAVVVCLFSVSQVTACQERLAPHADMQFGCSRLRDKSAAVQALEPRWDEEVRSLPLCLAISLARISTFSRLGHSSCAKVSVTRM